MLEILQFVSSSVASFDPVASFLLEALAWVALGFAVAVLLICAAWALAQCCGRGRQPHISALLLALSPLAGGFSAAHAQEARLPDRSTQETAVREIEPRLVRLWGRDSIRLSVNICGVQCSNQVSLSPDGRWLLLQSREATRELLWLAPTDGGEMIELAENPSTSGEPQWFPAGNAIAFTSPAAGSAAWRSMVMRLPISRDDGRPQRPARQVSLEPAEPFAISPDGDAIAYIIDRDPDEASGSVLKVIPATGGNPISEMALRLGIVMAVRWGVDGRDLYLLTWRNARDVDNDEVDLFRVPARGGEPELISVWDEWVHISPRARYLVRSLPSEDAGHRVFEAATLTGRPLARFRLPDPFDLAGFGTGPGKLLAVRQDIVNPLRVIPVAGGPVRLLDEAWGYDLPLAWTGDGREVFFRTTLNGEQAFMLAPVNGGPMRQVPLPWDATRPQLSSDGSRVLYFTERPDASPGGDGGQAGADLHLYAIESDTTLTVQMPAGPFQLRLLLSIGENAVTQASVMSDALFACVITRRERHEVWLVDRSGATTLGWSLPEEDWTPGDHAWANISLFGNRLAFAETTGGEGTLYLAMAGDDRARPILTLPGMLATRGTNGVLWSPDGRLLIMSHRASMGDRIGELLLVEVNDAGERVGDPRPVSMEGGAEWLYGLQWMPDGEHFLGVGGPAVGGPESWDVWIVSLDPGTAPVNLTRDIDQPIWSYHLSPDGRYIAIESEIPRGSSIWQVDLGDILAGAGR